MKKKILIIGAHPDDEILGCGGTVARLVQEGCEAYTLLLGEGKVARYEKLDKATRLKEVNTLRKEAKMANDAIGVKKVYFSDFPDNSFDSVPLIDIIKTIEKIKIELRPDIVFTNYDKDLNIDHKITYQAVITATRPVQGESVKEVYAFEVLSSTEWSYPTTFSPDTFFDISQTIDTKLKAIRAYKSELRKYPHPRSAEGVEILAKNWGMKTGSHCAEAFKTIRVIK